MAIMRVALGFILAVTILHVIGSTTAAPAQVAAKIDAGVQSDLGSIKDRWEKTKHYFNDLQIDIKEKYMKFGEWVKDKKDENLEKLNGHMDKIKRIADMVKDHVKDMREDVVKEGRDYLEEYKKELGPLWDEVEKAVKEVLNRGAD